ncbi:cell wall protein PhiA [Colletotrichum scovillei]|uniref:cell wall protein PhiA n=1 Tax=Colletotrichum scovillei TaxID=1209932 RepID=UPI0015C34412|nr:cell wall protein PhiA [Colletotrichum scovillei]KAF4779782.1 cell wall protein PhiA [Colletotrichum scovillei]
MQFTNTLAVATSLIAAVSGAAVPQLITRQNNGTTNGTAPGLPADAKFQLMALRSASEVHFSTFQAAKSSIFLQLPNQNATCDSTEDDDSATFYLNQDDGGSTSTPPPPPLSSSRRPLRHGSGQRTGWKVDQYGDLTLDGASFLACPNSIEDSWSVWISSGVANPAGNTDCLGIAVRAVQITDPNSCSYTS